MKINNPSTSILINNNKINDHNPVYFIAEIGSNYDRSLDRAKDLIYLAKEAGAHAAKFQHYTAETLVSDYGFKNLDSAKSHQAHWEKSVYDTYDDASLNAEWTSELAETCKNAEIDFFTSPYSFELVDIVDEFVPAYKIGSGDITWIDIVRYIANKGKPVLLATGAASFEDVKRAVNAILEINENLILMQCNTNYTANSNNYSSLNLSVLSNFKKKYPGLITGLSDHMQGHISVLGAVALGARVIEKHFTDDINRTGPDHPFSMTKETFKDMVDDTKKLQLALGDGIKKIEQNEEETIIVQRRSICAKYNLNSGKRLERQDLEMLRPCTNGDIEPYRINDILGLSLTKDMKKGEPIKLKY